MPLTVDPRVAALETPKDCEVFAKNAAERGRPDLAQQARVRAVQIRAAAHGATTEAAREALAAVYAYEEVQSQRRGRRTRASRTWQMIQRHGVIHAVERAVDRTDETVGYAALLEMGLAEFTFEAVILRHPDAFSAKAVARSRERVGQRVDP